MYGETTTGEPGGTRLNNEGTHDEANMIRAWLNKNNIPHPIAQKLFKDWNYAIEHKAEPGDYDEALKAIEEIKLLAEKESSTAKVLYAFGRALHNIARVPGAALWFIESVITGGQQFQDRQDAIERGHYPQRTGHGTLIPDTGSELITESLDQLLKVALTDAEKKLKEMKTAGKVYARAELKTDKG